MDHLRVHNWDKWQTYRRDRGQPPWIKVHREVSRHFDWLCLSDAQRGQLVAIWILAADRDGLVPAEPEILQRVCGMSEKPDINLLIDKGFLDPTPERRQHDATVTPERRHDGDTVTPQIRSDQIRSEENGGVASGSPADGEPDLDRLLTAGLIECYTDGDSCNGSVTETDDPVPQRQRQSIVQSTEQRTENGAVLQLASGSPADRAAAREEKNRQLSDQWEAWVQALKDANDTPDNVIDDFVAELEACVNRYYEGRGGAFTPKRRATFAARMGKLQFDHQMFAIEVYCDSNAGKADERYCIGIAQRLARTDDKELDQQMMAHRRANKGTGLNARAGTA